MAVARCRGRFVIVPKLATLENKGVTDMAMAYVLLVHLMLICPAIRLLSVSMREHNAKRL